MQCYITRLDTFLNQTTTVNKITTLATYSDNTGDYANVGDTSCSFIGFLRQLRVLTGSNALLSGDCELKKYGLSS